ncbi:Uncharacterized protein FWK35_00021697 [Aphis craccivora]|uniref:DUF7044 domain-containing protein n=1 Tax=Aphis craccivora TaxID=307492 RepID=A0A6G0ZJZ1_APHCR|nr:Uncharacterized protein FWK35_00021697 [Aphis craccivora]
MRFRPSIKTGYIYTPPYVCAQAALYHRPFPRATPLQLPLAPCESTYMRLYCTQVGTYSSFVVLCAACADSSNIKRKQILNHLLKINKHGNIYPLLIDNSEESDECIDFTMIVDYIERFIYSSQCEFPAQWSGRWFQSGVNHHININTTTITTKGDCVQNVSDKFLIEDRYNGVFAINIE